MLLRDMIEYCFIKVVNYTLGQLENLDFLMTMVDAEVTILESSLFFI